MAQQFDKDKFIKKEEWLMRGDNFSVSITHVFRKGHPELGIMPEHCWCLYATIFSKHRLFKKACENSKDYDLDLGGINFMEDFMVDVPIIISRQIM